MRYALPVTDPDEILPLSEAGAGEFYCGFLGADWAKIYGSHDSMTRRQGAANLMTYADLRAAAEKAAEVKKDIWLTLNGRYTSGQTDNVAEIAERWNGYGGTGVIVREPALLERLVRGNNPVRCTVSLLACCMNREAVRFWRDLGAERIVLPRELNIEEMHRITEGIHGCTFEAMVSEDRCLFMDGFCRSVHADTLPARTDGLPAKKTVRSFGSGQAYHLCADCYGAGRTGCAACRLNDLERAGVSVGKFGGRGTPLAERMEKLVFFRKAEKLAPDRIKQLHTDRIGICDCYYDSPEVKTW